MEKLVEKITCKKCSCVSHGDIETLNKETIKVSDMSLTAVVIKKFKCGICSSTEADREFVKIEDSEAI